MNSLRSLKSIIVKLTEEERKILIKYLKYNNDLGNYEPKSVQLVKILMSDKNYSINDIQIAIYGKLNYYAFNKLLNRLKLKIFEVITFDSSLSSSNYSKRNKVLLELRKKLLQADILQLKGLRSNVLPVYNNIIKRSQKFELYDIQVSALTSKQRLLSINTKFLSFKKINDEINYAENCLLALKNSNNLYKEITNKISNSTNHLLYLNDLTLSIKKLEEYYRISKSPTIGYYLYTLSTEMWQNKSLYNKAHNSLENLKNLLLKSESAYTENRYGTTLLNLSNNNIFLYQFDKSIILANESKKYFKNLPLTLMIVDEILFYAYLYNFDFDSCKKILIDNRIIFDDEIMNMKFNYYKSCLLFLTKNYSDSLSTLLNYKEIEKDKDGWNINRRILLIMNRIELEDYESVDLQMQSLEQFIKRVSKSKIIKTRYIIILRILKKLVSENNNFKIVYGSKIKYFTLLESDENDYKWEIKSPELVIFHDWFKSKINGSSLNNSIRNLQLSRGNILIDEN